MTTDCTHGGGIQWEGDVIGWGLEDGNHVDVVIKDLSKA